MDRPTRFAAAALVVGAAGSVLLAAPASAAPCEGYSAVCATTGVATPTTKPVTDLSPERPALAATGGEVLLLTVVGAGALAGGTALVVAGRRRSARRPAAA